MKIGLKPGTMEKVGLQAVAFIIQNMNAGIDKDGKPFQPYSTRPFAMPLGAFFANTTQRQREALRREGDLNIYRNKSGKRWIVIDGGYLNYKQAGSPSNRGVVNLQYRGKRGGMISQLGLIGADDASGVARIGFAGQNSEAAQIAYYHVVTGVGKGKVIRNFLGLIPAQKEKIKEMVLKGITIDFSMKGTW